MRKSTTLLLFLMGIMSSAAQEIVQDSTKHWKTKGNVSLLFNQSSFNNWVVGGENNLSGNLGVNYDFNYKYEDWTWDNKIIAAYGLVKTKNSPFEKKTDDRLEITSLLGKKAKGYWSYSAFANFKTQFTIGYIYDKDANGTEIRTEFTDFLSPAYLTFGPGMLWKKNDNLKFNIAPLSSKFTFVDKTQTLPDEAYFGVKEGEAMRYELGFHVAGYYKMIIMANVSVENILVLYSNYLEDPQNIDLDYQMNIVLRINKYLTTNIALQAIYDDNAFRGFQTRQVFGVAANYGF
ncbi:hypothetical protein FLJC2902T_05740 [Flavobacterium limnosediminis JC2902]|uniref:DUF3078 domain-containing protein n=1 Tax=Flavobacterium limnosediminis JC2902 TaxID=1341181 RepID=V6T094_9FLAO|nr:DUF3078 domain-containing protein [Flavobacterium limnosediminis]ESU30080.1 hypothetical protein FLJC2902T_05740 [Flavobacterium limnosediminis JC2902]